MGRPTQPAADCRFVRDERESWRLLGGRPPQPTALVRMDADSAWRMLYNALPIASLMQRAECRGPAPLVDALLGARSVIL